MSDRTDEEKIEVVLAVRLPMSVKALGRMATVLRKEYEQEFTCGKQANF